MEWTPVLTAQSISLMMIVIPILLGFSRDRSHGLLILVVSLVVAVYSWFAILELQSRPSDIGSFPLLFLRGIEAINSGLIATWTGLASWLAPALSALGAWAMLVLSIAISTDSKFVRGAKILPRRIMINSIKRLGLPSTPVTLGGIPIPEHLESRCVSICGEPGTGKTQTVLKMMLDIIRRSERFACIDVGADIYRKIGTDGDIVLSISHSLSVEYSPFADIQRPDDCQLIADSLIPAGTGESQTWHGYARSLLAVILDRCVDQGSTTNFHLVYYAAYAPRAELLKLVRGTTAQRIFDSANEKKVDDVLGIISQSIRPIEYLNPQADHNSFSVRKWISGGKDPGNLWLIYDDTNASATANLRALWINLLIYEGFRLELDSSRRVWLFLDELASHGKIDSLSMGVSMLRKFGVTLVLAFQNINQLFTIYGREETLSILGSLGHQVILRTPDPDTAEFLSRAIGDGEIRVESRTVNRDGAPSSSTFSTQSHRAVLPSEISILPDLTGYLKLASVGWVAVDISLMRLPDRNQVGPHSDLRRRSTARKPITDNETSCVDDI